MMDRTTPLPFVVVALLAFMGLYRVSTPSTPVAAVIATQAASAAGAIPQQTLPPLLQGPRPAVPTSATAEGDPESWLQTLRLYGEFFGLPWAATLEKAAPTGSSEQTLRLYDQLFGLEWAEHREAALAVSLGALAKVKDVQDASGQKGYELDFLVALVPDPVDSQMPLAFDQTLDAIQEGLAAKDYLLNRNWLPWEADRTEGRLYRRCPGLLLFRRRPDDAAGQAQRLLGVFLVGETPKLGIHQAAFSQALRLIGALGGTGLGQPAVRPAARRVESASETILILGPTFSGSAESLRMAVVNWLAEQRSGSMPRFEIVTGSATASGLETILTQERPAEKEQLKGVRLAEKVDFFRTVLPDDVLWTEALHLLHDRMGWDLGRLALLRESDTLYGQVYGKKDPHDQQPLLPRAVNGLAKDGPAVVPNPSRIESSARPDPRPLVLGFSSHISAIRTTREAEAERRRASQPEEVAPRPAKTDLALSLADRSPGADLVPEFSPLIAPETELAIANLLDDLSREGIRYVGIVATDERDKLFLADRVRRSLPDTVLFAMGDDLLFTHPQAQASMKGLVVISTFPLFTEGVPWLHEIRPALLDVKATDPVRFRRRQFVSQREQGIFHAIGVLLRRHPIDWSQDLLGWISVNSGGSLWPVLTVDIRRRDLEARGVRIIAFPDPDGDPPPRAAGGFSPAAPQEQRREENNGLSQRADFELLLLAALLCGASAWMRRVALIEQQPGGREDRVPGTRGLLACGLGLMALAGASLPALDALCYLNWGPDNHPVVRLDRAWPLAVLLALLMAYLFQVWALAKSLRPDAFWKEAKFESRRMLKMLGWLVAAGAALVIEEALLVFLFIPGEVEYFHLRARVLSSGLSPIVTCGWLCAALFVWVLLELKRRRLILWREVPWPVADAWHPALRRCSALAAELCTLIDCTLPRASGFWMAAAAALAAPLYLLWQGLQPLAETRACATFLLLLLLAGVVLGATSFYRFWQVWQRLQKLLLRVEQTPLAARFAALQREVAWKPMRSFGWHLPRVTTLTISTERLKDLVRQGRLPADGPVEAYGERVSKLASEAFAADCCGSAALEVRSRDELRQLLWSASQSLGAGARGADLEEFLALRVIAYLRYVFAHLRSFLMGALLPGLLLFCAISSYAFQPKRFLTLGLLGVLLATIALTLAVFVAMNRNRGLSLIAGHKTGEISFDRAFFANVLTYAVLPLLGLVATQVPEAGQLLDYGVKPLLRIFAVG